MKKNVKEEKRKMSTKKLNEKKGKMAKRKMS